MSSRTSSEKQNRPHIIRAPKSKDNPYVMIRRDTLQDDTLTWEARGVIGYLLSKPDDWEIQVDDLKQQCGRDRVYRILKELIDHGYMTREQEHNDKGVFEKPYYQLYEQPHTENPDTAQPDTVQPYTANTDLTYKRKIQNIETAQKKEEKESSGSVKTEPDKDPTPTPEPVAEKTTPDGDQYLLLQEPLDRLDSLRNECKLVKEPDKRTNYKGYTKHPFYEQTKRVFMYGCAIDGQPFERWSGLKPLVRWFHNEALGKNGQPATLLELLDFMTWYHRDTSGYNMPRERSRMVHHWGRWKKATDKRQSRRVLNGDPRNMSPLARTPEQQAHAWKKKVG